MNNINYNAFLLGTSTKYRGMHSTVHVLVIPQSRPKTGENLHSSPNLRNIECLLPLIRTSPGRIGGSCGVEVLLEVCLRLVL